MSRHSEFNACHGLAADARQRADLLRRDAIARDAMRRACITRNDRRRVAATRRARIVGALVGGAALLVSAYAVAGFIVGGAL